MALAITILVSAACGAWAADARPPILAAREARDRGDWRGVEAARQRLRGDPLAMYPAYWLLAGDLAQSKPAEITAFLDQHAGSVLADQLRRDWLRLLGREGDWERFNQVRQGYSGDDLEVACYTTQARARRAEPGTHTEALKLWASERDWPAACSPLSEALLHGQSIATEDLVQRARRALVQGRQAEAKRLLGQLPAAAAVSEAVLDQALRDGGKWLHRNAVDAGRAGSIEAALGALLRLAKSDALEAHVALGRLQAKLPKQAAEFAWGLLGWQAALQQRPEANQWYRNAGINALPEPLGTWRVRAALRARDWVTVTRAILLLPASEQQDGAWRYWRARALLAQGQRAEGEALLGTLAGETGYYALLAAEELGALPVIDWTARPIPAQDLERIAALPAVVRALALYAVGMRDEGFREWIWAIRGMTDDDLLAAAELARQRNVPDRAIATALRTRERHDFAQRYPLHHLGAAREAAAANGLALSWVYAVIRQESRFMQDVRSRAGAVGLMQLMPTTARWAAGKLGWRDYHSLRLIDAGPNIALGSYYLRSVYDDLGEPILATAAYNAGPGRARRWRDDEPLEGAIYAETIPFNETRDYVKQVLANQHYYEQRLTGSRLSMKALLGTVAARGARRPASERLAVGAATG